MEGKVPPAFHGASPVDTAPPPPIFDITTKLPKTNFETIDLYTDKDPATVVEQLLDENAGYFAAAEDLWVDVKPAIERVTELLALPRVPVASWNEETGAVQRAAVSLEHTGRENLRSLTKVIPAASRQALGEINQRCFDHVQRLTPELDRLYEHKLGHTYMTLRTASTIMADAMLEAREEYRKEIDYKPKISNLEDLSEAETALRHAYMTAFSGQYLVNRKLEELLANDRYAPALIERLEALASADKNEPVEYPGLLEAIATHMDMYRETYPDCITAAMERISKIEYSKIDFIRDLFAEDATAHGKKYGPDFTPTVLGAQAIARVVTSSFGEVGITAESLAELVSEYYDDLPQPWQEAYEARAKNRAVIRANAFANHVKLYAQGGRRRSNIGQKIEAQTPKKEKKQQGKSGSKNSNQPSKIKDEATHNIQDVTREKAPEPSKFSVLKRFGESGKQYTADVETTHELDSIMTHPVIGKFLAEQKSIPGIAEAVQASLEDIANNPYQHNINVEKLVTRRVSIVEAPKTLHQPIHMRRYRPKRIEAASNAQTDRLRITYVFFRVAGKNIVAIENIELRNGNTYRS